ncbi:hypothetical protein TWF132_004822 [Orbilia oligospora]|nr:hypothetical protein TWF132_004822 [Orbilia oligospora]
MTYFLIKYIEDILAIDTDGIKSKRKLDFFDTGSKLGDMKHEFTFKEFVTIAPK